MSESIEVRVHGQVFKLRTEAGKEYINDLASYVDGIMSTMTRYAQSPTADRLAIMAALRIADDLFQLKRRAEAEAENLGERIDRLVADSDRLLEER